jgi:hypothetical protein
METQSIISNFCRQTQLSVQPDSFTKKPFRALDSINIRSTNTYIAIAKTKKKRIAKHLESFNDYCQEVEAMARSECRREGMTLIRSWELGVDQFRRQFLPAEGMDALDVALSQIDAELTLSYETHEKRLLLYQRGLENGLQTYETSKKCVGELSSSIFRIFRGKRIRQLGRRALDGRIEAVRAILGKISVEEGLQNIKQIRTIVTGKREITQHQNDELKKQRNGAMVSLEQLRNKADDLLIGEKLPDRIYMEQLAARIISEQGSKIIRDITERATTPDLLARAIDEVVELVVQQANLPHNIVEYLTKCESQLGTFLAHRDLEAREWAPSDDLVVPGRTRRRVRTLDIPGGTQAGKVAEILLKTNPQATHTLSLDNNSSGSIFISYEERLLAPAEIRELQLAEDLMMGRISPQRQSTMVTIFDDETAVASYRIERHKDADQSEDILVLSLVLGLVTRDGQQVYRIVNSEELAKSNGVSDGRIAQGYLAAIQILESASSLRRNLADLIEKRQKELGAIKVREAIQQALKQSDALVPKEFVSRFRRSLKKHLKLLPTTQTLLVPGVEGGGSDSGLDGTAVMAHKKFEKDTGQGTVLSTSENSIRRTG